MPAGMVHTERGWLYGVEAVEPGTPIDELLRQAPHDCSVPGCPGPENKAILDNFAEVRKVVVKFFTARIPAEGRSDG